MAEQQSHDAWVNIREIQLKHEFFYQIALGLVFIIIGIAIGALLFSSDTSYGSNVYLNVMSVFATVVVLNRLAERREEQREEKALKERLVMEAGSQSNEIAKHAVDVLRHRNWLTREVGLLKETALVHARLQNADLSHANMQGTSLIEANLQSANLSSSNLNKANLFNANLQEANLFLASMQSVDLNHACLKKANLSFSNLQSANLNGVKLQGADLQKANLRDGYLERVEFDEFTILPDGRPWTPDTDMTRFTDPSHPNFWRSDNPNSPAYRGKSEGN